MWENLPAITLTPHLPKINVLIPRTGVLLNMYKPVNNDNTFAGNILSFLVNTLYIATSNTPPKIFNLTHTVLHCISLSHFHAEVVRV